ncbi:MAG: DNA adenine methylase, partial [Acidimicrobiales bacterium]
MIKYLGSKRRLVPVISAMARAVGARTALDMFTGTTRVAQALKRDGAHVTAVDAASYSEVLAQTYIATDAGELDTAELDAEIDRLNHLAGTAGYVTEVFCKTARFFHPDNGARIDAIRDRIESDHPDTALRPVLLASLLEAADRVDSTTGVQMAYLKTWAPRALRPIELRRPELLAGKGMAVRGDAARLAGRLGSFDFAYLDPPYNQHRYFTNYHVWETLVRWDSPVHYGIACKRADCREAETASDFNRRSLIGGALRRVLSEVETHLLVLSYNDESFLDLEELVEMCSDRGSVDVLGFDQRRYVGAQIGIHAPSGAKVGTVGRLRNVEWMVVCGP